MSTLAASVSTNSPRPTLPPGYIGCACGLAYSPANWLKLPLVSVMDDGVGGQLELRNCVCGSTRARKLETGSVRPLAKCRTTLPVPPPAADAELEVAS